MKKINIITIVTILLSTTPAYSDDKRFGIFTSTFTNHILGSGFKENKEDKTKVPFNEDNNVIGVYIPIKDKFRLIFGEGENSYYKQTYLFGAEFQHRFTNYFSLGTDIAFASGYGDRDEVPLKIGDYSFMGGPHANFNIKKINFKITLVPASFVLGTAELRF